MTMPIDPELAHLRAGDYAIVRWPEARRWILTNAGLTATPDTLAVLEAADVFMFTKTTAPELGTWWAVTTEEQKALLTALQIESPRIFTRADLLAEYAKVGNASPALETASLLDLLKTTMLPPTQEPAMADDAATPDDQIPPDDRLIPHDETHIVEKLEGPDNPWMEPFRAWFSRQDVKTRSLIPALSPFWYEPAWMLGNDTLPCGLLLSTTEQEQTVAAINAERVQNKLDAIPAWGPTELQPFYGDSLLIMPPQQLARCVFKLCQDAATNVAAGARVGEGRIAARMANLITAAPLTTTALLSLIVAREVCHKSLLACSPAELAVVNDATGKLLMATGLAHGPLDAARLPKPHIAPPFTDTTPGPGQYI